MIMIIIMRYGGRPGWRGVGSWELAQARLISDGYGLATNISRTLRIASV
jgi:hypothetical protein